MKLKLPNPHEIKHAHYKRCMFCGLCAVLFAHLFTLEFVGVMEAAIGIFILYDPTGAA